MPAKVQPIKNLIKAKSAAAAAHGKLRRARGSEIFEFGIICFENYDDKF